MHFHTCFIWRDTTHIYRMALFSAADGVEENAVQLAASRKGQGSAAPLQSSAHGCLKNIATVFPTAVGSAENQTYYKNM